MRDHGLDVGGEGGGPEALLSSAVGAIASACKQDRWRRRSQISSDGERSEEERRERRR